LEMEDMHGEIAIVFCLLSKELMHHPYSPGRFSAVTELKAMLAHVLHTNIRREAGKRGCTTGRPLVLD
jgi:hypothetical protein